MTRGAIFWVLMILAIVLGVYLNLGVRNYAFSSMTLLELALFGLLGWQVFGPAVKG